MTILVSNAPRVYSGGWRDSRNNRETVATSLQLAFTECFAPAMQSFDWSLDNSDVNLHVQYIRFKVVDTDKSLTSFHFYKVLS